MLQSFGRGGKSFVLQVFLGTAVRGSQESLEADGGAALDIYLAQVVVAAVAGLRGLLWCCRLDGRLRLNATFRWDGSCCETFRACSWLQNKFISIYLSLNTFFDNSYIIILFFSLRISYLLKKKIQINRKAHRDKRRCRLDPPQ